MMREALLADLAALGVRAGDLLMVHASLRRLGLGRADIGHDSANKVVPFGRF